MGNRLPTITHIRPIARLVFNHFDHIITHCKRIGIQP